MRNSLNAMLTVIVFFDAEHFRNSHFSAFIVCSDNQRSASYALVACRSVGWNLCRLSVLSFGSLSWSLHPHLCIYWNESTSHYPFRVAFTPLWRNTPWRLRVFSPHWSSSTVTSAINSDRLIFLVRMKISPLHALLLFQYSIPANRETLFRNRHPVH